MEIKSACGSRHPSIIEDKSSLCGTIKRYKVCNRLGKGGFAAVYRVQSLDTNNIYAIKIINKSRLPSKEHFRKLVSEIKLHQSIHHQHVVSFEKYFEDKKYVYILLELCSNGSLMSLSRRRKKITEWEVRYLMLELLDGLKYLHNRFIIHRDLKLGNLLLDDRMTLKICDFGLAARLSFASERKTTICGTPNYTAPEILNQRKWGEGHSYEVDIWSVSVIMFTLLTGKPPFETSDIKETYHRIKKIKYQFPPDSDTYISKEAKQLISSIFTKEPAQRPNLMQISNHSFFQLATPKSLPPLILQQDPTYHDLFGQVVVTGGKLRNGEQHSHGGKLAASLKENQCGQNRANYAAKAINTEYHKLEAQNVKHGKKESTHNFEEEQKDNNGDLIPEHGAENLKLNQEYRDKFSLSVIKYIDYRKKYGLGYLLSNGCTGIYFNDSTKILLSENKRSALYVDVDNNKQYLSMDTYPPELKKKVTLLKHFADFLWKPSSANKNQNESNTTEIKRLLSGLQLEVMDSNQKRVGDHDKVYVKAAFSDQYCILFKLSNSVIQVNFTDSSQIMVLSSIIQYTDKTGQKGFYSVKSLRGCNKDLRKRCKYAQQLLESMAS